MPLVNTPPSSIAVGPQAPWYEIRFTLTDATDNPFFFFDPAAPIAGNFISVDVIWTAPDGSQRVHPAFFLTDVAGILGTLPVDTVSTPTAGCWCARYEPDQAGTWSWRVRVTSAAGTRNDITGSFVATANAAYEGVPIVSPTDNRFFKMSVSGRPLRHVGTNVVGAVHPGWTRNTLEIVRCWMNGSNAPDCLSGWVNQGGQASDWAINGSGALMGTFATYTPGEGLEAALRYKTLTNTYAAQTAGLKADGTTQVTITVRYRTNALVASAGHTLGIDAGFTLCSLWSGVANIGQVHDTAGVWQTLTLNWTVPNDTVTPKRELGSIGFRVVNCASGTFDISRIEVRNAATGRLYSKHPFADFRFHHSDWAGKNLDEFLVDMIQWGCRFYGILWDTTDYLWQQTSATGALTTGSNISQVDRTMASPTSPLAYLEKAYLRHWYARLGWSSMALGAENMNEGSGADLALFNHAVWMRDQLNSFGTRRLLGATSEFGPTPGFSPGAVQTPVDWTNYHLTTRQTSTGTFGKTGSPGGSVGSIVDDPLGIEGKVFMVTANGASNYYTYCQMPVRVGHRYKATYKVLTQGFAFDATAQQAGPQITVRWATGPSADGGQFGTAWPDFNYKVSRNLSLASDSAAWVTYTTPIYTVPTPPSGGTGALARVDIGINNGTSGAVYFAYVQLIDADTGEVLLPLGWNFERCGISGGDDTKLAVRQIAEHMVGGGRLPRYANRGPFSWEEDYHSVIIYGKDGGAADTGFTNAGNAAPYPQAFTKSMYEAAFGGSKTYLNWWPPITGMIQYGWDAYAPAPVNVWRKSPALAVDNGLFVDIGATSDNANLEAVGEKDLAGRSFYLYIDNNLDTIKTAIAHGSIPPQSGTIKFAMPAGSYTVGWHDPLSGALLRTETRATDAQGNLSLPVTNLTSLLVARSYASVPQLDVTPPVEASAQTNTAGTEIIVDFSEAMNATGSTGFSFPGYSVGSVFRDSALATRYHFSLVTPTIVTGVTVTGSYAPGNFKDLAGNPLQAIASFAVKNNSTTAAPDTVPPTILSALVPSSGDRVRFTLSEPVDPDVPTGLSTSLFAAASVVRVPNTTNQYDLLPPAGTLVYQGATGTASYAGPVGNSAPIVDRSPLTNALAAQTLAVTNQSTQLRPAPLPPTNLTATPGTAAVAFAWGPSPSGTIASQTLAIVRTSDASTTVVNLPGTATSTNVTGLDPNTAYTATLTATDAFGLTSLPSAAVSFSTLEIDIRGTAATVAGDGLSTVIGIATPATPIASSAAPIDGFTITQAAPDGSAPVPVAVTGASVSGDGSITLTHAQIILGYAVQVSYTPGTASVTDAAGGVLAAFTLTAINGSAYTPPTGGTTPPPVVAVHGWRLIRPAPVNSRRT